MLRSRGFLVSLFNVLVGLPQCTLYYSDYEVGRLYKLDMHNVICNTYYTVDREIFTVKKFSSATFPNDTKYFVWHMRYAQLRNPILIIFRPIPTFVTKSGDEN